MVDCVYDLSCEEPPLGVTARHVPQSVDEIEDEPLDILHAIWLHMRHHLQSIGDRICDARENDAVRLPRGSRDFGLFNIQDDPLLQLTVHTSKVTSKVLCSLFPRACVISKTRITVDIRRYLTNRVLFVVQFWVVGEVFQCSDESAESRGNNASSSGSSSTSAHVFSSIVCTPCPCKLQATSEVGGADFPKSDVQEAFPSNPRNTSSSCALGPQRMKIH